MHSWALVVGARNRPIRLSPKRRGPDADKPAPNKAPRREMTRVGDRPSNAAAETAERARRRRLRTTTVANPRPASPSGPAVLEQRRTRLHLPRLFACFLLLSAASSGQR